MVWALRAAALYTAALYTCIYPLTLLPACVGLYGRGVGWFIVAFAFFGVGLEYESSWRRGVNWVDSNCMLMAAHCNARLLSEGLPAPLGFARLRDCLLNVEFTRVVTTLHVMSHAIKSLLFVYWIHLLLLLKWGAMEQYGLNGLLWKDLFGMGWIAEGWTQLYVLLLTLLCFGWESAESGTRNCCIAAMGFVAKLQIVERVYVFWNIHCIFQRPLSPLPPSGATPPRGSRFSATGTRRVRCVFGSCGAER